MQPPASPPGARREVITSSKISTAPVSPASARRSARNSALAGMQPLPPSIGSTRIAARVGAVRRDQCARPPAMSLYLADQVIERRVDRAALAAEIKDAAVIAAVEHQDLVARPVIARAALTAIRLASVPELVKRTSSIEGKRAQIAAAKRASAGPARRN